ncbi:MAG: glutamine--fructose-6-phosphate transaminase (isomerizing) [Parcubacteria group bacterium]|nr:glutamine--fructose-6-phosphate transaminase (isomerizing) [Parcubacteria group bacterium]|tara:strand:+ start:5649 stop:7487 length:1839 start_codon:yes stop_codon:yes gene_type:complete
MCGIVGYIGKNQARPILLEGLRRLEYRGYDSAGVAVLDGDTINNFKVKGRVAELEKILANQDLEGSIGIAHTRWATHGEPSQKNAHPHSDGEGNVFVVHNGIIENYKTLKTNLEKEGHKFSSDTDTEVIAHLVSKFLKSGDDLEQAVRKSLRLIKGAYALLVMAKSEPETLIAARFSSPLRIGVGADQLIIASDPSAILNYTSQLVTLGDGEIAVIKGTDYAISSLVGGGTIDKEIEEIEWDLTEAEKGGYDHFMLKEIMEQPETVRNTLRGRLISEEGKAVLGGLSRVEDKLRQIERITVVACGTASYAALIGEYMLEEYAGIPTEVCVSSEFRYRKAVIDPKKEAVLVLSQSGETADTLAVIKEVKEKGVLTIGIANVTGSSIAKETDAGIYNHAGPEIGVASTKVFVSQLTVLSLLTLFLGRQRQMSVTMGKRITEELLKIPEYISTILKTNQSILEIAEKYKDYNDFFFLGRKYNFPIALEGALKLKEISYIHAEGGSSGELKHGPIAMIDENFPTVFVCPKDSVYEKNISNIEEVKARKGKIIAVATEGDEEIKKIADEVFYIPKTLEMLTPILAVVPLQLLAYHVATLKDCDVDKPRNLAKSVTVE